MRTSPARFARHRRVSRINTLTYSPPAFLTPHRTAHPQHHHSGASTASTAVCRQVRMQLQVARTCRASRSNQCASGHGRVSGCSWTGQVCRRCHTAEPLIAPSSAAVDPQSGTSAFSWVQGTGRRRRRRRSIEPCWGHSLIVVDNKVVVPLSCLLIFSTSNSCLTFHVAPGTPG